MSLNSVGLVRYVSSWAGQRLTIPSMPLKSGFVSNMNVCQRAGDVCSVYSVGSYSWLLE